MDETSSTENNVFAPLDMLAAASPDSNDSELPEELLADEPSMHHDDVYVSNGDSRLVKTEESMGDNDDDVDIDFYPRQNVVDSASSDSTVTVDHNYARISASDNQTAAITAHDGSVTIKREPVTFEHEDGESGQVCSEFGGNYTHLKNARVSEMKNEASNDIFSTVVDSLDSFGTSDSDGNSLYDSEKSDDLESFGDEYSSDSELSFVTDEPVRKKVRVAFGVDPAAEDSTTQGSLLIDCDVWKDPKMHMTPIVELEDVLQIILAWQQNVGDSDNIM